MTKRKWWAIVLISALLISLIPFKEVQAVSVSSRNAVLLDQDSGRVLFEKDAHNKERIASITKIMTAIIAVESGMMQDTVTVSDKAAFTEGSSLYLKPGQKEKLQDLVYGLMLRSGNDAAVAIAEHVGGSLEGFVYLMNEKAELIGMKNTHFANPHGLDDHENHVSTAYDMAILMQYAMKNEEFAIISGTEAYRSKDPSADWDRVWKNKNRLLTEKYQYCTGGKTGYTKRAKRTLVTTASQGDQNLIVVTLNGPDDWNDHIQLYEYGFQNYDNKVFFAEGEEVKVEDKFYQGHLSVEHNVTFPIHKDKEEDVKVDIKLVKPKWEEEKDAPKHVGNISITLDNQIVSSSPIHFSYEKTEEKKSFFEWFKGIFSTMIGINYNG